MKKSQLLTLLNQCYQVEKLGKTTHFQAKIYHANKESLVIMVKDKQVVTVGHFTGDKLGLLKKFISYSMAYDYIIEYLAEKD